MKHVGCSQSHILIDSASERTAAICYRHLNNRHLAWPSKRPSQSPQRRSKRQHNQRKSRRLAFCSFLPSGGRDVCHRPILDMMHDERFRCGPEMPYCSIELRHVVLAERWRSAAFTISHLDMWRYNAMPACHSGEVNVDTRGG
jgi:hypothetical protein